MYRLVLHRLSEREVRVTSGGYVRVITAPNVYRLVVGLKECFRDLLYQDFGKRYRFKEIEHYKSLLKSLLSAARRMQ